MKHQRSRSLTEPGSGFSAAAILALVVVLAVLFFSGLRPRAVELHR